MFRKYLLIVIGLLIVQPATVFAWWVEASIPFNSNVRGPGPQGSWAERSQACTQLISELSSNHCAWNGITQPRLSFPDTLICFANCDYLPSGTQSGYVAVGPLKISCPPPFVYNQGFGRCDAYCETGQAWDATLKRCTEKPNIKTCNTITANPINVFRGEKYRAEEIISVGSTFPIKLTYYYNNRTNNQSAGAAIIYRTAISRFLAATMTPLSTEEFRNSYTLDFLLKPTNPIQNQYRASWYRYWRHNYEEALQFNVDGTTSWLRSDGEDIIFSSTGTSAVYGSFHLSPLTVSEFGYAGYRISTQENQKIFDDAGKLRKIIFPNGVSHDLEYTADGSSISKIKHSQGAELNFSYTAKDDSLSDMQDRLVKNYPVKVIDNAGRTVDFVWNKSFTGVARIYYLLTRYSNPYSISSETARDFEYNDVTWPVSITDIYDVTSVSSNTRKLYAHFNYDTQGRAIYSGLAGGVDGVNVNYVSDLIRVVTNALGKKATYEFADFNGVKRLKRVTGEPTATCLKSEASYEYDGSGNIANETKNGVKTHKEYDSQNREVLRVEATGTSVSKTTTTEWHPSLNLKTKVTEADKETTYTYDANGLLTNQTTRATP